MPPELPWDNLTAPAEAGSISALRVDAETPWNFYWALDGRRRFLLVLRLTEEVTVPHLPRLNGLQITLATPGGAAPPILMVALVEHDQREVFHRLCLDIVDSTARAASEGDALLTALTRIWGWHHLLRGGSTGPLAARRQQELMAELLLLERLLIRAGRPAEIFDAWRRPLGAVHSFVSGPTAIVCKGAIDHEPGTATIESEKQLEKTDGGDLLLHHVVLARVQDERDGQTIVEVAARILKRVGESDEASALRFRGLLAAAGCHLDDDYSGYRWKRTTGSDFHVRDEFPRITSAMLSPGIRTLEYSITLASCEQYRIHESFLFQAFGIESHGH